VGACRKLLWLRHGDSLGHLREETTATGSHYQMTGEDIADREDYVHVVVNC
jgi:hypothetical protein